MKVTRILHASVNVTGTLEKTDDWYRGVVGLKPVRRPDGSAGYRDRPSWR